MEELLDKIELILRFYADGDYMEWEGCACHGRYYDIDDGKKAKEGMKELVELRELLGK